MNQGWHPQEQFIHPSLTENFYEDSVLDGSFFIRRLCRSAPSGRGAGGYKNGTDDPGTGEKNSAGGDYGLVPLTRELYADAITPQR